VLRRDAGREIIALASAETIAGARFTFSRTLISNGRSMRLRRTILSLLLLLMLPKQMSRSQLSLENVVSVFAQFYFAGLLQI
jgi:hypothetical protein